MVAIKYEQDPVNGKWHKVMPEAPIVQKAVKEERKKPCFTGIHAFWVSFFISFYMLAFMKVMVAVW